MLLCKRLNLGKPAEKSRTIQAVELIEGTTYSCEVSGFAFMFGNYSGITKGNQLTFLLDSGSSDHIINREDLFSTYTNLNVPLKISVDKHNTFISAIKKCTLKVIGNTGIRGTLEDVLFCPDVPYNLLSVTRMQQAGMTITFDQRGTNISKDGKVLMQGMAVNNLISIDFVVVINRSVSQICKSDNDNYDLWHQRLVRMSKQKFIDLRNNSMVDDVNLIKTVLPDNKLCEACINGKQTRLSFRCLPRKLL